MHLRNEYVKRSLDLNLFFLRIMKEHSQLIEIAIMPKDVKLALEAKRFVSEFERLLSEATELGNGNVSEKAILSDQFVTPYTEKAEKLTSYYTGKPININLTRRQKVLDSENSFDAIEGRVDSLNRRAYRLTSALVEYKERLFQNIISCKVFTFNYPSIIKHMLEEANNYMELLEQLIGSKTMLESKHLVNQQVFWNDKMSEHAQIIAGMLDPIEELLIKTAKMFSDEFKELSEEGKKASENIIERNKFTSDIIDATKRLRFFKIAATEGLIDCKIKSTILPILADHVLREANYYLCKLGECNLPDKAQNLHNAH